MKVLSKEVTPYNSTETKKEQVAEMFDNIAPTYDFLNHLLSMGIDKMWRKKTIKMIADIKPKMMLDVATGTGDFAIAALKLKPEKVIGVDISKEMLAVGQQKIKKNGYDNVIELQLGDSENLQFESNTFDAVTVAYGVRNFENLEKGLAEIFRVLKPTGKLAVLEFSRPDNFPIKQLFNFYFKNILPFFGRLVSKDTRAYDYLPESVQVFPDGQDFVDILDKTGFKATKCTRLSFGISSIYIGVK